MFALIAAATLGATIVASTLPIDTHASHATFSVAHVLIQNVTGRIPIVSGSIETMSDGTTPEAVQATLDPRHIDSGDSDRDGDLQGPDWFDTAHYPQWTFASTSIRTTGPGAYDIAGTLTIHGVGAPIDLITTLVHGGPHPAYRAVTHVDRHAFGMTKTRVDGLVGSDVTIVLDIRT
jgi:polyisoprenoid-binding protein YceI